MPAYPMNALTQLGVNAARSGNKDQARQMLRAATEVDDEDIVAWWWLGQLMGDPTIRHKCREKAQAVASATEEGSRTYKELLRESGAPALPRYRLAGNSKSVGDQCPICTVSMVVPEEVIVCPECHRA